MYKYLHDKPARTVYRFPSEPEVIERAKRGLHFEWRITMEYAVTRADNRLEGGRWKFATSVNPVQHLGEQYTRELAVSYFRLHHEPKGEEIDINEYEHLQRVYEAEAKSRRPNDQA